MKFPNWGGIEAEIGAAGVLRVKVIYGDGEVTVAAAMCVGFLLTLVNGQLEFEVTIFSGEEREREIVEVELVVDLQP